MVKSPKEILISKGDNFSQADMVQHCNQELSSDSTVVTCGFAHPTSLHSSVLITKAKDLGWMDGIKDIMAAHRNLC